MFLSGLSQRAVGRFRGNRFGGFLRFRLRSGLLVLPHEVIERQCHHSRAQSHQQLLGFRLGQQPEADSHRQQGNHRAEGDAERPGGVFLGPAEHQDGQAGGNVLGETGHHADGHQIGEAAGIGDEHGQHGGHNDAPVRRAETVPAGHEGGQHLLLGQGQPAMGRDEGGTDAETADGHQRAHRHQGRSEGAGYLAESHLDRRVGQCQVITHDADGAGQQQDIDGGHGEDGDQRGPGQVLLGILHLGGGAEGPLHIGPVREHGREVGETDVEDAHGDEQHHGQQLGDGGHVLHHFVQLHAAEVDHRQDEEDDGDDDVFHERRPQLREHTAQGGGEPHAHGGERDDAGHPGEDAHLVAHKIAEGLLGVDIRAAILLEKAAGLREAEGDGQHQQHVEHHHQQTCRADEAHGLVGEQEDTGPDDAVDAQ